MANSELIEALQALAHERKIDELYLIERLEDSLAKSYQRPQAETGCQDGSPAQSGTEGLEPAFFQNSSY